MYTQTNQDDQHPEKQSGNAEGNTRVAGRVKHCEVALKQIEHRRMNEFSNSVKALSRPLSHALSGVGT